MSVCRRTAGILDAWLDAGQLADRDAAHVARCPRCTDALARANAIDGEIRTAVRSLVFEAEAAGFGPTTPVRQANRVGLPPLAGFASLAVVVVLAVVVATRVFSAPPTTPGAQGEPLLPVAAGPAEQALHQSGLRCADIDTGLECTRRLSDGWRQVAKLEVAGGDVRGLEVRLVPGTGAIPAATVPPLLNEPAEDVLGVDLAPVLQGAIDTDGAACGCTRSIDGGEVHVEGDQVAGYLLTIEQP